MSMNATTQRGSDEGHRMPLGRQLWPVAKLGEHLTTLLAPVAAVFVVMAIAIAGGHLHLVLVEELRWSQGAVDGSIYILLLRRR
jgi:hypothetical protein